MKKSAYLLSAMSAVTAVVVLRELHSGWFFLLFLSIAMFAWWIGSVIRQQQKDFAPFDFTYCGRVYSFRDGHVFDDEGINEIGDACVLAEGWKAWRERRVEGA